MLLAFIFWGFSIVSSLPIITIISVVCRSMKKFHLVFLSCAEAWKSFIWCFCRVQKHEKVSFGVSVACRSMKNFHLVFLSCAEAWKSFIWCFCRVQKHEKVSFGVSDACRSMRKQDEFIMLLIFYVLKGRWWFFKISTAHDGLLYNKLSIFTFMK